MYSIVATIECQHAKIRFFSYSLFFFVKDVENRWAEGGRKVGDRWAIGGRNVGLRKEMERGMKKKFGMSKKSCIFANSKWCEKRPN